MEKVIVGFKTKNDIENTLVAMEKTLGLREGAFPSLKVLSDENDKEQENGGIGIRMRKNSNWADVKHYMELEGTEKVILINFKDAIQELTGARPSTVSEGGKVTDYRELQNHLGKNFTGKIQGKDITGTIKKAKGYPTLYFNYVDGEPDTYCWNYNEKINGVEYARGWHVASDSDFAKFRPITILSEETFTEQLPTTAIRSLPKYFVIKYHAQNPLWSKYISWLNKKYGSGWTGTTFQYYGYNCSSDTTQGGTDCFNRVDDFRNNPTVITLEEWDSIVNGSVQVQVDVPPSLLVRKIPSVWCIKKDEKNPLWKDFVTEMQRKYIEQDPSNAAEESLASCMDRGEYLGIDFESEVEYWDDVRGFSGDEPGEEATEITLEYWDEYIRDKPATLADRTATGAKMPSQRATSGIQDAINHIQNAGVDRDAAMFGTAVRFQNDGRPSRATNSSGPMLTAWEQAVVDGDVLRMNGRRERVLARPDLPMFATEQSSTPFGSRLADAIRPIATKHLNDMRGLYDLASQIKSDGGQLIDEKGLVDEIISIDPAADTYEVDPAPVESRYSHLISLM